MPVTIINQEEFATKAWRRYTNYKFAAQSNILPVVVAELTKLVPVMPMGFVQTKDTFQLVAITSLQPGTNLFVTPDGKWIADYEPVALRIYPFQMIKPQDSEESHLCFDTSSGLLCDAGQGEPFYDDKKPSQAIKDVLKFMAEVENSRRQTQLMVDALQAAGLIQPWQLKSLRESLEGRCLLFCYCNNVTDLF